MQIGYTKILTADPKQRASLTADPKQRASLTADPKQRASSMKVVDHLSSNFAIIRACKNDFRSNAFHYYWC